MYELMTTKEIQKDIASKIKQIRLSQNKTQEYFANSIGISKATYIRFENSATGSFETFLTILQGLGKISELEQILQIHNYSPLQSIKTPKEKKRKRASKMDNSLEKNSTFIKPRDNFLAHIKKAMNG
jgi:transcriptional regulator with XRE-family HTH domain